MSVEEKAKKRARTGKKGEKGSSGREAMVASPITMEISQVVAMTMVNLPTEKGDGYSKHKSSGKKRVDRKKIKCFNCQKFGHFADECKAGSKHHRKKNGDEAHLAHDDSDSEPDPVVLMTTADCDPATNPDSWYLDTGCSNHMTCRKEWLTDLDTSKRSKVRFADFSFVNAEGIGNVAIKKRDGGWH